MQFKGSKLAQQLHFNFWVIEPNLVFQQWQRLEHLFSILILHQNRHQHTYRHFYQALSHQPR